MLIWPNPSSGQNVPNEVQNNAKQRAYHVHCHSKNNSDTLFRVLCGWIWDKPRM
jgi:hypothetical protein